MNQAFAPAFDHYVADPVARHLCDLLEPHLHDRSGASSGAHTKTVRLLAASPVSPVTGAFIDLARDLAIEGYDFRLLFAERGPDGPRNQLVLALERARAGLARRDGVLRTIGTPAACKVQECLVLGDRIAWFGAPVVNTWETATNFGRTVQRPSAVHIAAMGIDALRAGSQPWEVPVPALEAVRAPEAVIRSLYDWRPGEHR